MLAEGVQQSLEAAEVLAGDMQVVAGGTGQLPQVHCAWAVSGGVGWLLSRDCWEYTPAIP